MLGYCPQCTKLTPLRPEAEQYRCSDPACGAVLVKCVNYEHHQVCNRMVLAGAPAGDPPLCDCCIHNETIPDLSVAGNAEKWYRLEVAKRRLFYELDLLALPRGLPGQDAEWPLSFHFMADRPPLEGPWTDGEYGETVYTGYDNGRITINVREADDVERERLRVAFGEAHRTLIGHFRHEMGHYYWQHLVAPRPRWRRRFVPLFGTPDHPPYEAALQRYYALGPAPTWPTQYVSAYASMHPLEDFAESFATYLDVVSVLDTARHNGLDDGLALDRGDLAGMLLRYGEMGVALNEVNRAMGLPDLVPEIFSAAVMRKLGFVHDLAGGGGSRRDRLPSQTTRP